MKKAVVGFVAVMVGTLALMGCKTANTEETTAAVTTMESTDETEDVTLSDAEIQELLPGNYESENKDTLEIIGNADGNYDVNFGIVRLTSFDDGKGEYVDGKIKFDATAPNGKKVKGTIELGDAENQVKMNITDSNWRLLEKGLEFSFNRK